ncbi:MAG: 30S ribosomal protein S12 methylthiotransferase RimO [Pseudomonadota bacterium]
MNKDENPALSDSVVAEGARRPPPKIGMVSLGCPKALVDSERILSRLRAEGYVFAPDYAGAEAVIVNTCGFLDSAKEESLDAIGEAIAENGRVIVTGCLGEEAETIRKAHPNVLAVTGSQAYEAVVAAVREAAPIPADPFTDLAPRAEPGEASAVRLTPRHYAYLKISEGCDHKCRFCIIPSMRGRLASRSAADVVAEGARLVRAGVRELLVISQDTSAYGKDLGYAASAFRGAEIRAHIVDLARALGGLRDEMERPPWVRLHYVYPYPHVDDLIPLMSDGAVLPYLDIPFQHASPKVLKSMRRPADEAKTLDRIAAWRAAQPDLALRSTFIVGFPGETEADFEHLLSWLTEAGIDRVGCFKYENVAGAAAAELPDHVPEPLKQERWERLMAHARALSEARLKAKIGRTLDVIIDDVDEEGASGRSRYDAPEVDGAVFIDSDYEDLSPGDVVSVEIDEASDYDLWGGRVA